MWKSFAALVWVLLGGIPQCSRMYWMKNFIRASSWSDPASRACYGSFPNLDDLLRRPGKPWVQAEMPVMTASPGTGLSNWKKLGPVQGRVGNAFAPRAEAWSRWSCSWAQKWSFTDRPGKSQGGLWGGLSFPDTTASVGLRSAFLMSKWLLS